jgi:ketosteroid isomerase-like protein
MRITYLAALIVCLTLPGMLAAGPTEQALQEVERNWAKAVLAGDLTTLDKILAEDLIYAHSTGMVDSKSDYLAKLREGQAKYEAIDHEAMTVKVYGESAVVHSRVRMRGTSATGGFNNYMMMLHVWVNQGGNWKLAAHQTTRLP